MNDRFQPLLTKTDWGQEWKALQSTINKPDDPAKWDARAKTFPTAHGSQSNYVSAFLAGADIQPQDTVLDMGAGTGALSIPLAQQGCAVVAADFSRGMLDVLRETADDLGVRTTHDPCPQPKPGQIAIKQMSWFDDWAGAGIGPNSVDVALASRSIVTRDLKDSLLRLTRTARRRACITLPAGPTPRIDRQLMRAVGLQNVLGRDFLYAFNILAQCGMQPEVSYIESPREDTFASFDAAYDKLAKIVSDAAVGYTEEAEIRQALARLRPWLEDNLIPNPHTGDVDAHGVVQEKFCLRENRKLVWAFIAWDTSEAEA